MYRITHGSTSNLPDVDAFLETLNRLDRNPTPGASDLFDRHKPIFVARAPGRLDVMGGIADYSGSLVLQLPIREATLAACQRQPERSLKIVSLGAVGNCREPDFDMPMSDFETTGQPISYDKAQSYFGRDPARQWAAYAAGAFLVLMRERHQAFADGARILIASDVPEGKGVSSSAAIEVAVMQAIAAAYHIWIDSRELAILCQKVENLVVGAPCGVMDQMTASCGQAGQLLALLCQPAELREPVAIPDRFEFWGLDSGVRHFVSGADYGSVRVGAFMGYRIIAELAGLTVETTSCPPGIVRVNDPLFDGYLANITPDEFNERFADRLPTHITGREFLARYAGTTDPVTTIDPDQQYAVRTPTSHPVRESFHVRAFRELLAESDNASRPEQLGQLMYQSHASYSACGLGCDGTDRLVELVREAGPSAGLFGAKITGGGSGGTVAVLAQAGAGAAIDEVADRYENETGHRPYVFTGSSPGSGAFGHLVIEGTRT